MEINMKTIDQLMNHNDPFAFDKLSVKEKDIYREEMIAYYEDVLAQMPSHIKELHGIKENNDENN